jgi:hypothetical protein
MLHIQKEKFQIVLAGGLHFEVNTGARALSLKN